MSVSRRFNDMISKLENELSANDKQRIEDFVKSLLKRNDDQLPPEPTTEDIMKKLNEL